MDTSRTHAALMGAAAEADVYMSRGQLVTDYERAALRYRKRLNKK